MMKMNSIYLNELKNKFTVREFKTINITSNILKQNNLNRRQKRHNPRKIMVYICPHFTNNV